MSTQQQTKFQKFLDERKQILKEIKEFVIVLMDYVSDMVQDYDPKKVVNPGTARSLIQSLCNIHGLYGYPDSSGRVNKYAVREIVLKDVSVRGKTFGDFCAEVKKDEFWQLREFALLREPAHIFLQLVRDLFGGLKGAGNMGKKYLEKLPDVNYLKPAVWAQHKDRSECFGVSLGVRPFVRPVYLYIKLSQLRRAVQDGHNSVDLKDVIAKESKLDKRLLIKSNSSDFVRTKWEVKKDPCHSCQVFFWFITRHSDRNFEPSFLPFGNCAEYDVIRTSNLDCILRFIAGTTPNHWREFESACLRHLTAFQELTRNLKAGDPPETTRPYHTNVGDAKILKYQMYSTRKEKGVLRFRLIAHDWLANQKEQKINKRRRKTAP